MHVRAYGAAGGEFGRGMGCGGIRACEGWKALGFAFADRPIELPSFLPRLPFFPVSRQVDRHKHVKLAYLGFSPSLPPSLLYV